MEGPVQDTFRDPGDELRVEAGSGIGRLEVRRLAKVCFVVACKVTACNIKRWARPSLPWEGSYTAVPVLSISFSRYRGPMWRKFHVPGESPVLGVN